MICDLVLEYEGTKEGDEVDQQVQHGQEEHQLWGHL